MALTSEMLAGLLYLALAKDPPRPYWSAALGIPAAEAAMRGKDLPWLAAVVTFGDAWA
jgi:hypothetical protein